jgi:hypothetical protein
VVITSRLSNNRSGKIGSLAQKASTTRNRFMLTSEDPNNNRVVGSVHSFRWPPRSSTRRAQTIDDERRIAPKKSMRLSLERLDCLGFDSSVDTWSFQATRAKASIVGRHCPRKDLLYG